MFQDGGEIEELKRRLYSRASGLLGVRRHDMSEADEEEVESDWERETEQNYAPAQKRAFPLLKFAFVGSVVFFIVAVGFAFYFLIGETNIVSSERIAISVEGPATVDAGKPLSLVVTVENQNAIPLQLPDLLVEYPEGTKSATDLNIDLPRGRESLGDLPPGASVTKTVKAVLFGQEMEQKSIRFTVEYRVPGSNAIFYKEKSIIVTIGSAPLSVSIDAIDETSSNQAIQLAVTVASNSTSPVQNLLLRADYPFGFSFTQADVQPAYGNAVWNIGDLPPGGKRTVRISGTLAGEDNEERVFKFSVGSRSASDAHTIGATFITTLHRILVQKPFVGVDLALNGETTKQVIMPGGATVRADVVWVNNLPNTLSNLVIQAKLSGVGLNPASVSVPNGFYRSADNTIIWDKQSLPQFASLDPGASGTLQFSFAPVSLGSGGAALRNQSVTVSVTVSANRRGENNVPEEITSVVEKKAIFASDLILRSVAVYSTGPFQNSGSLPPKTNKETTYTILWSLSNSSNAVSRARVSATLPPYVRFVGVSGGAPVTFNQIGGAIVWDVGSVPAGAGFSLPPKEVAFQVAFLPSVSQVGTTPVLLNVPSVTGDDQFTGTQVSSGASATTIDTTTDPLYKGGEGVVVQ